MTITSEISQRSPIPAPHLVAARQAAQALWREGHILAALEALHDTLGDVFQLPLPGFRSIMAVGPEANRLLLTDERERFLWRAESDPVTRLLRHGLLVVDGAFHDELRQIMTPALHRSLFDGFSQTMCRITDRITDQWREAAHIDAFTEARRIALLIVTETLFGADTGASLDTFLPEIVRAIRYISPGPWLVWPSMPRPGYSRALRQMDIYMLQLIARRRAQVGAPDDLLGRLIASGMPDDLIRDQMLTLIIAGHDTSTALLSWTLYLLVTHPDILARVQSEVDTVVGMDPPKDTHGRKLPFLDCVLKETMRLYPPIHLGSRIAATDTTIAGYHIPTGARVLYSIYLTQRDERYWPSPHRFNPERFAPNHASDRVAYTYLPFGGGPRTCLGASFAQVEAKVVLARILQRYELRYIGGAVHPRMRATLEPSPGVFLEARHRRHK